MGLAKLPSKRRLELRSANGRRFFGCRTARGNLISIVLICLALEAVAGRHIAFDLRSISSPFGTKRARFDGAFELSSILAGTKKATRRAGWLFCANFAVDDLCINPARDGYFGLIES